MDFPKYFGFREEKLRNNNIQQNVLFLMVSSLIHFLLQYFHVCKDFLTLPNNLLDMGLGMQLERLAVFLLWCFILLAEKGNILEGIVLI